jgi:hypothetical protein
LPFKRIQHAISPAWRPLAKKPADCSFELVEGSPMSEARSKVVEHYAKSGLLERLEAALRADGGSGGWLVLSEIARGEAGEAAFPTPWAATAAESFLATTHDTRKKLQAAGFQVEQVNDALQRALDFAARSRAMVERGEKPPYRANALIHGSSAAVMLANVFRAYNDRSLLPIEVVRKR